MMVVPLAIIVASAGLFAAPSPVSVRYHTKVAAGQTPRLELVANEPLSKLIVRLTREDGHTVEEGFGPTGRGQTVTMRLDHEPGRHRYQGEITLAQGADERRLSIDFETQVTSPLQVEVDRRQVDLEAGRLVVKASRPVSEVLITVHAPGGAEPKQVRHAVSKPADEPFSVTFPVVADTARLDVKVTDVDGYYTGVSLLPWSLSIPHEEVAFARDKADIAASERPKLEGRLKLINEALARARSLGPVALYIAGHTDTVGEAVYNLKLSSARAAAIARHFRARGLRIPIFFEGFGEHSLAVATPDETDEPRNRRVDYILALEPPHLGGAAEARWKSLP